MKRALPFAVVAAVSACAKPELPPRPQLWTLSDFAQALGTSERFGAGPTLGAGLPAEAIVAPPGGGLDDTHAQMPGRPGVRIVNAFVEGKTAAYATTEIWQGYEAVWVQPMYVLTRSAQDPGANVIRGTSALFGVGTRSTFYSPFWRLFFAVVPPGADTGRYVTPRAIFDDGLPIVPGPDRLCPLARAEIGIARAEAEPAVRPVFGEPVTPIGDGAAVVDGEAAWVMDFGGERFVADAEGVVEEAPLFVWAKPDETGAWRPAGLPNVGGTGPLFARRPTGTAEKTRIGALWRLHLALLPAGAEVFAPERFAGLRGAWHDRLGVTSPRPIHADIEKRPDVGAYAGRVALTPACFGDPTAFPRDCRFLDSQAAIEDALGGSGLRRGEILVACILVFYDGRAVPIDPLPADDARVP